MGAGYLVARRLDPDGHSSFVARFGRSDGHPGGGDRAGLTRDAATRQPTLVGVAWGLAVLALVVAVAHNMRAPGCWRTRCGTGQDKLGRGALFGDPTGW
jgi:hypothetical protein